MNDEEFFGLICFMILMQRDQNVFENHPDYIKEKIGMIKDGYGAYTRLDRNKQNDVMTYYLMWKMDIPQYVLDWEIDYAQTLKGLI